MEPTVLVALIPIIVIGAFWAYMVVMSLSKSRVRELEIRERIAMIEKGLVPAPEVDPRGFDRAMSRYDRRPGGSYRHRRAGVTLIGVGTGLMLMIAFAGEDPQKAIGIGGFIVMIGVAFVINGLLENRQMILDQRSKPDGTPSTSTPDASNLG